MTSSKGRSGPRLSAGLAAIAVLGVAAVWLQALREREAPAEPTAELLYVTSPAVATRLALSYRALAADVYWMRVLQYYGGLRLSGEPAPRYELLYPLLDLTTSLDPAFSIAYRFGAFFLAEPQPGGAGRPDLAVQLLEKGRVANPHRWEYPYDIGFVHYRSGDYARAADWFSRAEDTPGAPSWLGPLAAVTSARGGDTTTSRILWRQILEANDESWIRRTAERRLLQLDAIDQIARLQRLAADYERRHGAAPQTWDDLVREGLLPRVPRDSTGTPYALTPDGAVTVSQTSPLWPLPMDTPA